MAFIRRTYRDGGCTEQIMESGYVNGVYTTYAISNSAPCGTFGRIGSSRPTMLAKGRSLDTTKTGDGIEDIEIGGGKKLSVLMAVLVLLVAVAIWNWK